jgi:hypothetical protein
VRDQHERGAVLVIETEHEVGDLGARCAIEVARRLVGHQELGIARECARDRDPLLLAARQLPRIMRGALAEADAIEPDARTRLGVGRTGELERQHDVLQRGQRRQELERLEHESEETLSQRCACVLVESRQRLAVDVHLAGGRTIETRQEAEQRRLPEPDAPTMAMLSPGSTANETPSRMVNGSSPLVTTLVSASARMMESDISCKDCSVPPEPQAPSAQTPPR